MLTSNPLDPLPEQTMYRPYFDLVAPADNWKRPIDAVVRAPIGSSDYALFCKMMRRAVEFYAGGGARITEVSVNTERHERTVRVTAPGYYAKVGA